MHCYLHKHWHIGVANVKLSPAGPCLNLGVFLWTGRTFFFTSNIKRTIAHLLDKKMYGRLLGNL